MRKYAIVPVIIIICGLASFFIGYYLFKIGNIENEENQKKLFAESSNTSQIDNMTNISIKANNAEEKITPNTKITKKIYYIDCKHIKQHIEEPTEKIVNMNKSQFQAEYVNWEIQKFTSNEVVIYKEVYDYCNDHYIVKEESGNIVVYKLDKYDREIEKIQTTDIETRYLTENDLQTIKKGLKVYSKKELNSVIEDFE